MMMSNWKEGLRLSACHLLDNIFARHIHTTSGRSAIFMSSARRLIVVSVQRNYSTSSQLELTKIIIINTWCSVNCSPNAATDVIRKRCCCWWWWCRRQYWSGRFAEFRQLPFLDDALINVSSSLMHVTHRDEINRFNCALIKIFLFHRILYRQHYRS